MGTNRFISGACLLAIGVMLNACAETNLAANTAKQFRHDRPKGNYKIGEPYQINGLWYYPAEDFSYNKTGIASWYGSDFHGKYTANGEMYDMNDLTAAHKTLPLPSIVRVTNLDNGRSIVVRINDRGPFVNGRIIDMSRRAAQLLGYEKLGTAKVRVEIMAEESRILAMQMQSNIPLTAEERASVTAAPRVAVSTEVLAPPPGAKVAPQKHVAPLVKPAPPPAPPRPAVVVAEPAPMPTTVSQEAIRSTHVYVQVGAFTQFENANKLRATLSSLGHSKVQQATIGKQQFYRVRIGPVDKIDAADAMLDKIIHSGHPDAQIIVD